MYIYTFADVMTNPFLLKGYLNKGYFCDREEETEKIITAIRNRQDLTIHAYRRLGKSALLKHVESQVNKEFYFVYIDIWGTSSVPDFLREISNGIIQSSIFSKRGIGKRLQEFIKSIGTSFTIGLDGRPSIDVIYNDLASTFKSLQEVITFLNNQDKPVVLAIDEFQEIKKYDSIKVPIEATLRKLTQGSQNIRFIYSGSEFHLINDIFNTYNRPFYQSTRMIQLGKIPKDKYQKFILDHFKKAGKPMKADLVTQILDFAYLHTYYVQAIFNYLFGLPKVPNTWNDFEQFYYSFIEEKGVFYAELPDRITPQQFVVTKAFARAGLVAAPTGSEFLRLANFTNSSSMRRAVKALEEKQIIIKDDGFYRIYDVFLGHYLKFNFSK